jgi:hypothetical protein
MARKKRETMVAEAAPAYEARHAESLAEVFWLAFKGLPEEAQGAFIRKFLDDPEWFEELADAIAIIETRGEPTQPLRDVLEELEREGL